MKLGGDLRDMHLILVLCEEIANLSFPEQVCEYYMYLLCRK